MKTIDIICPIFNEEKVLPIIFERLVEIVEKIQNQYKTRLLFIDNCSEDKSQEFVRSKCLQYKNVNLICLTRNFGYQASIECGLKLSHSDLTAIIDADGEDPPDMLLKFLHEYENGHDIVYGERIDRDENIVLKSLRKIYYRLLRLLADDNIILDMAEFSLITAEVRKAITTENNSFPFFRSSISRVGFSIKNVPYKRCKRLAGKTHYNFWRMSIFAFAGFLTSSTILLRLPAYFTPFYCIWFALLSWFYLSSKCLTINAFLFFISTSIFITYFMGVALCLYTARTYKNGLQRKNFIVNEKKSFINSDE